MTKHPTLSAGRCVVITTRGSPLKSQIEALIAHLQDSYGMVVDYAFLEDVFSTDHDDPSPEPFEQLVHQLIHNQFAVVDLCVTADSFYLMGVRHALSNAPTLMLAPNGEVSTVANARFTKTQQHYVDVSKPDWMDKVPAVLKYLNRPQQAEFQSDLRATAAFKVTPLERPFSASKLHDTAWQLNASGNPATKSDGPRIVIWEYQIQHAKSFDVWVNSENTFMEMARFWDRSVSAQIRKLGSVRRGALNDESYKDALGLALAEKVGTRSHVPIGTVFMTRTDDASTLSSKNNVSHVAHLAAVTPNKVGDGFSSGGEIDKCMHAVFEGMRKERRRQRGRGLNSVLFPLIGSGDGGAHAAFVAHQMVISLKQLISQRLSDPKRHRTLEHVTEIGLIAFQRSHLDFLRRELANNDFVEVALRSADDA